MCELLPIANFYLLGLKALSHLDLSNNHLKRLQNRTHGLLEDCLSIRSVNLRNNNIPFITKKMFPEHKVGKYFCHNINIYFYLKYIKYFLLYNTNNHFHFFFFLNDKVDSISAATYRFILQSYPCGNQGDNDWNKASIVTQC